MPNLIVDSDMQISIGTLADAILALNGLQLAVYHEKSAVGDIRHSYAATTKAQHLLSYHPSISLNSGLQLLINSCRK